MEIKVTNSLVETMFTAKLHYEVVDYASSKGLMKPFIKTVVNDEPIYDGYYMTYQDFRNVMDDVYF